MLRTKLSGERGDACGHLSEPRGGEGVRVSRSFACVSTFRAWSQSP